MQPLRDAALPLIATLLTLTIEPATAELDPGAFNGEAGVAVSFLPKASVTVGQSLLETADPCEGGDDGPQEPDTPEEPIPPVSQEPLPRQLFYMGLDKALDQFCRDHLDQFLSPDKPATGSASPSHAPEEPSDLGQHARTPLGARAPVGKEADHLPLASQEQMIDEVIRLLWSDQSRPTRTSHAPTPVSLTPGRDIAAETGPTVATVPSTEPINGQEGVLLSWWERGYELLTGFAVSLWAAAGRWRRAGYPEHLQSFQGQGSGGALRRAWSSPTPRRMVARERPVAAATAESPPQGNSKVSAAAEFRRSAVP